MKTQILTILLMIWTAISSAQIVNIPDTNFKAALIEEGVDKNGDGEISYTEAENFYSCPNCWWPNTLSIDDHDIIDLTGIEAFTNLWGLCCSNNMITSLDLTKNSALKLLHCDDNPISSLDVSQNTSLLVLNCRNTQITSLDVTNNLLLSELYCSGNQLTSLNVTHNQSLVILYCNENQLNDLDVSACRELGKLDCSSNNLTQLDLSNNDLFSDFPYLMGMPTNGELIISQMPTLYGVCVSELPLPEPWSYTLDTTGSPNVYFTTDCSSITSIASDEQNATAIYPNPATRQLTLELLNTQSATLELYSAGGKCVYRNEIQEGTKEIDVSGLSRGLYFLRIRQEHTTHTEKIVLQ